MTGVNTGVEIRHAFRRAPAWGQPAQTAAGDGIELVTHTLAHRIERIPHGALGHAHSPGADKGNIRVEGYLETHARYGDLVGLALAAGSSPAPALTGTAAYTHIITPADNVDGLCATWVERRKTYTLEATLKPHAFSLYGDAGRPSVWAHPQSAATQAYHAIAGQLAAQLSIIAMQREGAAPNLTLDWQ